MSSWIVITYLKLKILFVDNEMRRLTIRTPITPMIVKRKVGLTTSLSSSIFVSMFTSLISFVMSHCSWVTLLMSKLLYSDGSEHVALDERLTRCVWRFLSWQSHLHGLSSADSFCRCGSEAGILRVVRLFDWISRLMMLADSVRASGWIVERWGLSEMFRWVVTDGREDARTLDRFGQLVMVMWVRWSIMLRSPGARLLIRVPLRSRYLSWWRDASVEMGREVRGVDTRLRLTRDAEARLNMSGVRSWTGLKLRWRWVRWERRGSDGCVRLLWLRLRWVSRDGRPAGTWDMALWLRSSDLRDWISLAETDTILLWWRIRLVRDGASNRLSSSILMILLWETSKVWSFLRPDHRRVSLLLVDMKQVPVRSGRSTRLLLARIRFVILVLCSHDLVWILRTLLKLRSTLISSGWNWRLAEPISLISLWWRVRYSSSGFIVLGMVCRNVSEKIFLQIFYLQGSIEARDSDFSNILTTTSRGTVS